MGEAAKEDERREPKEEEAEGEGRGEREKIEELERDGEAGNGDEEVRHSLEEVEVQAEQNEVVAVVKHG